VRARSASGEARGAVPPVAGWPTRRLLVRPETGETGLSNTSEGVCVVGAGPAGMCVAAALQRRGVAFDLLDDGPDFGGIWDIEREHTPMYESAHFISSRSLSGLPGFPMPESYPDYPRHDRILEYVRAFARHHGLARHARFGAKVTEAYPDRDGWRVKTGDGQEGRWAALCVATGANWHPRVPEIPGSFDGELRHTFTYRSEDELRGRRVLVIGAGNSGCDIACDAARVAERAFLSLRRGYHFVPKYVFGRPADVFAHEGPNLPPRLEQRVFGWVLRLLVGDLTRYGLPKPDHPVLVSHPIMNTQVLHHLGHGDLVARPDVAALEGDRVRFVDGSEERVDLVLTATGYERRFPFLAEAHLDRRDGDLDLYLNVFHRRYPKLSFAGVFETDGAAYGLFGLQAELIAGYLADRIRGGGASQRFDRMRATGRPDLRGGRRYLSSARHAYYVRGDDYERILSRTLEEFGWV